jgi:hypothetical protein
MSVRDWINIGIMTLVAVVLGTTFADIRGALTAVWTLVVLGYILIFLAERAGVLVRRSRFDEALVQRPTELSRPEDLQRCERSFGWKSYSLRDFDHEVRPQLAALVAHRARAKESIDEELAELLHPTVPHGSEEISVKTRDLTRLVQKIEQL